MSIYYLMSQLPSLDGLNESAPLPVTQERFDELCREILGEKTAKEIRALTLIPPMDGGTSSISVADKWNKGERNLRLALKSVRADRLKKPNSKVQDVIDSELMNVAHSAMDIEDPMEAERFLSKYRLDFLETLRPIDYFSQEAVFYYGLKLKLLSRMKRFDKDKGEASYKKIYNSIINGEGQEAMQ